MQERRANRRHWINGKATASSGLRVISQYCRVRDASAGGVGIWLGGPKIVPIEFDLAIEGYALPIRCRLAWRTGDFVGVRFV